VDEVFLATQFFFLGSGLSRCMDLGRLSEMAHINQLNRLYCRNFNFEHKFVISLTSLLRDPLTDAIPYCSSVWLSSSSLALTLENSRRVDCNYSRELLKLWVCKQLNPIFKFVILLTLRLWVNEVFLATQFSFLPLTFNTGCFLVFCLNFHKRIISTAVSLKLQLST